MQQINLYSQLIKPPKLNINPTNFARFNVGFLILLMIIYLLGLLYTAWQDNTLAKVTSNQKIASQQLADLNKQYANSPVKPLKWQNQTLEAEIQTKQDILAKMRTSNPNEDMGYSEKLLAFAKAITPGVWLNQIQIEQPNQDVTLSGSASNNVNIIRFMQNLNNTPRIFAGKKFSLGSLKNADQTTGIINFTLSTKVPEPDGSATKKST